jgi:hypothetical protein
MSGATVIINREDLERLSPLLEPGTPYGPQVHGLGYFIEFQASIAVSLKRIADAMEKNNERLRKDL